MLSHTLKVTQLPGHLDAKCPSRWVLAYSPALSMLPTGLCISIFSSAMFPPFPLPRPSLPLFAAPFQFSACPSHQCPSGFSASLSHFLCLLSTPALLSVSSPASMRPSSGIWAFKVPGDNTSPAIPCFSSALWLQQEGWAKGRGRRPQQPNLELGPGSDWERNEETRNLGTEGVGRQIGQRLPQSYKSEPLPALRADLGFRPDFAQRSGPWMIRRLHKKTMDPGS